MNTHGLTLNLLGFFFHPSMRLCPKLWLWLFVCDSYTSIHVITTIIKPATGAEAAIATRSDLAQLHPCYYCTIFNYIERYSLCTNHPICSTNTVTLLLKFLAQKDMLIHIVSKTQHKWNVVLKLTTIL